MVERSMAIKVGYSPKLVFYPASSEKFQPLEIPIPYLGNDNDESKFCSLVSASVKEACGSVACSSLVHFSTSGTLAGGETRMLQGANIRCEGGDCPLGGPGNSGDREPLRPYPNTPSLEAEVPLPT